MASDVEIVNMAFVPMGVDRIESFIEETEPAKKANALYWGIRDEELSNHTWSFAIERKAIAQTTNTPAFEFSKEFQIPIDCLRVLRIDSSNYKFKVEGDKILTDYGTPSILYIKKITDPTKFSQQFVNVLVSRLKYELAIALTGSKTLLATLYDVYARAKATAYAIDSQGSGTPESYHNNSFILSRY